MPHDLDQGLLFTATEYLTHAPNRPEVFELVLYPVMRGQLVSLCPSLLSPCPLLKFSLHILPKCPNRIEFQLSAVINDYIAYLFLCVCDIFPFLLYPHIPQPVLPGITCHIHFTIILALGSSFGEIKIKIESYSSHHCEVKSHI